MDKLIINYVTREKRFARIKGNTVEQIFIEQPKHHSFVGNIYLGTVTKVLTGMNAAFVDIGAGKSGYLHRDKLPSYILAPEENKAKQSRPVSAFIHQGEKMMVQVEKDATGTKGPRLTGIIEIQGDHLIYMPNGRYVAVSKKLEIPDAREKLRRFGCQIKKMEEGLIFRTSCAGQSEQTMMEELEQLRKEYESLLARAASLKKPGPVLEKDIFFEQLVQQMAIMEPGEVIVDDPKLKGKVENFLGHSLERVKVSLYSGKENIFSAYRLEHEIEKALKRIVWLENGAYLIFDETEALTIIDVNTGKFSGKHDLQDTVVQTNILAAQEIARQIRLRDIGGIVLIDFIDMKEEQDRQEVTRIVEAQLKKDERRTKIVGFTPLGILQLTRKKTKVAISEALTAKCKVCDGTGRVLSAETVAFQLERELWGHRYSDYQAVWVVTTEEVKNVFAGESNIHKYRLEETLGLKIFLSVLASDKPFYEIRQFGTESELRTKPDSL